MVVFVFLPEFGSVLGDEAVKKINWNYMPFNCWEVEGLVRCLVNHSHMTREKNEGDFF